MTTIDYLQKELEKALDDISYYKRRIERLNNQLQQKENIIKEAINYIKEESWFCYKDNEEVIDRTPVEKLLEILDKENK